MGTFRLSLFVCALFVTCAFLVSCASAPQGTGRRDNPVSGAQESSLPPLTIMGKTAIDEDRLVSFFLVNNPTANRDKVVRMARYYVEEGNAEGVRADVAFVQMCLETGFLRFGGAVTVSMNNFCGLGTIGQGQPGNSFPDERTGVRAHVQHLKAYASAEPLVLAQVDPRYKYVNPKGKAPTIQALSGTWAADRQYGTKLMALLEKLHS